jgi:sulfite dehydrogenase (quinone) subunit SoeC
MNPAYSVIFFTTASGAGYGLLALLGLEAPTVHSPAFVLVALGLALVLVTAGLLSSTFHLGRPERAWRALSQWRSSWLSREGVAAILTYPVALLFGLAALGFIVPAEYVSTLGFLTAILSFLTVFTTGKIYATLKTIRAWNTPLTVPAYLFFALATGAVFYHGLATLFGVDSGAVKSVALVALAGVALLKFLAWRRIDQAPREHTMADATGLGKGVRQWEVPHTSRNFVQREMGFVVARRHAARLRLIVLTLIGVTMLLVLSSASSAIFAIIAPFTAYLAAWVERWLFFAEAEHVVTLYYGNPAA